MDAKLFKGTTDERMRIGYILAYANETFAFVNRLRPLNIANAQDRAVQHL